jgi:EAL domain-containing protein (putative c-di-GMP-specific phosphodiesterase class I)
LRRQVIGSPAEATAGPLARSVLALRIRNLADRPAALISVGLEQGDTLAQKLPALVRCEIEQALAGRIAARVQPGDAFGPWQDFHFLVMAARPNVRALQQLAHSLKTGIDVRPVVISRGQIKVVARIQMTAAEGDPQRWLEQALTLWARASGYASPLPLAPASPLPGRPEPPPPADSFLVEDHSADGVALRPDASLCMPEYQPLVLVRGGIAGQWQQRLRLRLGPGQTPQMRRSDILEPARRAGTLAEFDRIAIRLALETLVSQRRQGRLMRIFLEVDVATVIEPGFADTLEAQIAASMLREADLTLELDTDATIAQIASLRNVLARLRKIGVHTCLRHFGLQRDALRLLQMVNIDVVKLDTDLALQAQLSFQSLIAQIRDNGVPMAVEGVPDRHAIAQLWNLGIDYIQCDLLRAHGTTFDYDFQATEA